jgi:hypothetical protein
MAYPRGVLSFNHKLKKFITTHLRLFYNSISGWKDEFPLEPMVLSCILVFGIFVENSTFHPADYPYEFEN